MLVALGCGASQDAAGSSPDLVRRDSAGVTIVEHPLSALESVSRWTVSATPSVAVGSDYGSSEAYEFYQIQAVDRLSTGEVVVLDGASQEIRVYDERGEHLRSFGGRGEGPGEFMAASWLLVTSADSLAVYDRNLRRLTLFDAAGRFGRTVALGQPGPGFRRTYGLLGDGSVLVSARVPDANLLPVGLQRDSVMLRRIAMTGEQLSPIGTFPGPQNFWFTSTEELGAGEALAFGTTLEVAVGDSPVYVGRSDRYEIHGYDESGKLRQLIRMEAVAQPVTPGMMQAYMRRNLALYPDSATRERFRRVEEAMPLPAVTPKISRLRVDREHNLWVRTCLVHPDSTPDWHVFARTGSLLATVRLPAELDERVLEDGRITGLTRDAADVERVVVYNVMRTN